MLKHKVSSGRGRPSKTKLVKKELTTDDDINITADYQVQPSGAQPSVQIAQCISYQKFRYSGENRPGKKYQEKDFMLLKLNNLYEKVVRVVIICTDADNRELIHPNGLVGRDCHDGIFDKKYSITKTSHQIKIPYLRIERIKTKKDEHRKIQSVLQDRAHHLPSPYKERCLSQCNDNNYTANRKFDTTKVCLGVIVTVLSHQRHFNGFLHAISHVVRNANAKTKMGILKLSDGYVSANTGREIDIFTTEEGPVIEPDKYLVSVSYEGPLGNWVSDKFAPSKEDILYKRVIKYEIPPFELKRNLDTPVTATLHLECPLSNQYCNYEFCYTPQEYMIIEEGQMKRSYEDEDIKIGGKRMKFDTSDEHSSDVIKANLKTKLKAKQDYPAQLDETISLDQVSDGSNQYIVTHDKIAEGGQMEQQILVTRLNAATGESSVLLDMDSSKPKTRNTMGNNLVVNGNGSYSILDPLKGPPFKQIIQTGKGEQEVRVVATGYSDALPPNTVYIYTTNGDRGEPVTIDGGEQIVLQEVTDEESLMITDASILMKNVTAVQGDHVQHIKLADNASEQIVRREALSHQVNGTEQSFIVASSSSVQSSVSTINSKAQTAISSSQGYFPPTNTSSSASLLAARFTSATSSPSAIPPLRRMLIPSKMQSSSPWAVEGDEDSSSTYNIVVSNDYSFSGSKTQFQPHEMATSLKSETRSDEYAMAENMTASAEPTRVNNQMNAAHDKNVASEKVVSNSNNKSKLSPLEEHLKNFVENAGTMPENLPTIQVAEYAQDFENEREEEEEVGVTEQNSNSKTVETTKK